MRAVAILTTTGNQYNRTDLSRWIRGTVVVLSVVWPTTILFMQCRATNVGAAPPPFEETEDIYQMEERHSMRPAKQHFITGAQRNKLKGEIAPRYDLVSPVGYRRVAVIYGVGAINHGERNWEKGMPASDVINHAVEHLRKYLDGDRTEDHPAKIAWAMFALMHYEERNPDVVDIPGARGKNLKIILEGLE